MLFRSIFVDTFKDTTLSAKGTDPDFRIETDPVELSIRPLYATDSFKYNFISGTNVTLINNKVLFSSDIAMDQRIIDVLRKI